MASDLNRYVGSLEYLPHEVQKNLEKLRDLDSKMQVVMKHTDRLIDEYLKCDFPSKDKKSERMVYIDSLYGKAKRYSDSKVKLSYETYEMVDKNIKRLDLYLSRFQAEIEERAMIIAQAPDHHSETKHRSSHRPEHKHDREKKTKSDKKPSGGSHHHANGNGTGSSSGNKQSSHGGSSAAGGDKVTSNGHQQITSGDKSKDSDKRKKASVSGSSDEERAKLKKKPRRKSSSPGSTSRSEVRPSVIPEDIYDMPVDPNEPVYCVCRQVSYGDMVACDDQECSIEWFHFSCVGLTATPKGKWYCKECTENRKKKK